MKKRYFLSLLLLLPACKKFLQVPLPPGQSSAAVVFSNDTSATAAILSIYDIMNAGGNSSVASTFISGPDELTIVCGGSADELVNYSTDQDQQQVFSNSLTASNGAVYTIWSTCYQAIYSANAAVQGLSNTSGVTPTLKTSLLGEAKFVRAFCYFYLVNLFGEAPLILGTNYQTNDEAKRSPAADIYQQIINDLLDAQEDLSIVYTDAANQPSSERVRPVRAAATALLARVYLYTGDYQDALTQASAAIAGGASYSLVSPDSVFLKNSNETIWALQPPGMLGVSTFDAMYFIPEVTTEASLSPSVINAFEPGDLRRSHWVGQIADSGATGVTYYYYPYKYKQLYAQNGVPGEYPIMLRLAEQYLIRAEARAWLGDITGARADLNILRFRAGLPATTAITAADLRTAILRERQVELFTEMGHRWLDLRRTGLADAVLSPLKPGWTSDDQLYPVPAADISLDPALLPQNPGY